MVTYTLAFIFDPQGNVALVRKNRPANLASKWNGIGGKIEPDDINHFIAAARKLKEEADIDIEPTLLKLVGVYGGDGYEIRVMGAIIPSLANVKTMTDEEVRVIEYNFLFENGDGLLLDKHALMFLQAAYIAVHTDRNFLAVITDKTGSLQDGQVEL
jgi:8-oxo-dGTP pyrophosphatase MutT (NUDIX family)